MVGDTARMNYATRGCEMRRSVIPQRMQSCQGYVVEWVRGVGEGGLHVVVWAEMVLLVWMPMRGRLVIMSAEPISTKQGLPEQGS